MSMDEVKNPYRDWPAFPINDCPGLNKREYIATAIMAGMCANPGPGAADVMAKWSVEAADMLLAELEK